MYVEVVKNRNSPPCTLVRESTWEDGKSKKRTVCNITHLPPELIETIRRQLKDGSSHIGHDSRILRSLPHGHVWLCLSVLKDLGMDSLLHSRRDRNRDLAVAMIVDRILDPASKLATARHVSPATETSTLGRELNLGTVSEKELYGALKWLLDRQPAIETKLAARHLSEGCSVLYDLSSTYYEGRECPLAEYGHNRDGKKGKRQINFGLLTDEHGRPIAIEVLKGSASDPSTVPNQVRKLRERFKLNKVVVVGDRGMLTSARIREDLDPHEQMGWVSALRADQIRGLVEQGDIELELFDHIHLAEITSDDYPNERLVVCRNPTLAEHRATRRDELLDATEQRLKAIQTAVHRPSNPYRGAAKIGARIQREVSRFKMLKHFELEIEDDQFRYRRNPESIESEAALDGIYVVRAGRVPPEEMAAEKLVETYKQLTKVEQAFRSMKTISLKVRPIFLRDEEMVQAHIFLCMLAYYLEWEIRKRLAPLLFQDDDPEAGKLRRETPVEKAQRSPSATSKALAKLTADGDPVHSLRTLLSDLGTLCRNQIQPFANDPATFEKLTEPTDIQRKALELAGVSV